MKRFKTSFKTHFEENQIHEAKFGKLPKLGDKIFDVEGNKIGTVKKVNKDVIRLSTGDQVNSDSFYLEDEKWIAEL